MKNFIFATLLFSLSPSVFSETLVDAVEGLETLGTIPVCADEKDNPSCSTSMKLENLSPEKKKLILLYEHHKLTQEMCYDSKGKFRPGGSKRSADNKHKNFWVPFTCPGQESNLVYTLKDYIKATEPQSEKLKLAKNNLGKASPKDLDAMVEAELHSICYHQIKSNSEPKSCDYSSLSFPAPTVGAGKASSKFEALDKILDSEADCGKKLAQVQSWVSGFRAGDLDEQVLFELIKNSPQEILNNPHFVNTLKNVNLRSVPGATKAISGDNDGRLIISTYSNALISVQNDVLKEMSVGNSNDFHKLSPSQQRKALDQIVPRYLELLKKPEKVEVVAESFAKECDAKASRVLVGDEATCTVSGYAYAQKTSKYTNVGAYDSGPDGRFHCYPDKTFKNKNPSEGVYAPEGFSQAKLGYGSSCMMGASFASLCQKAAKKQDDGRYTVANELCQSSEKSKYSGARTISSFCGENMDSAPCRAAREACQDSRTLAYSSLGCYKKGITFNPSHIVGVASILPKKDNKTVIGAWGGCGSSHPGADGAHSHNQLIVGNDTLVDPVNVFCRGDCF